ncbi:hypothetical protein ABK040_005859 [Willaertia magna]
MVGFLKKRISSRSESPTGGRSLVLGAQDSDDDLPLQGNNPTSSSSIGTNNHTLTSTSSFTNGSTSNENEKIKLKKKKKKKKKKKSEFHIFGEPLDLQIKSLKTTVLIDEEEGIKVIYPKIFWECIKYLENNEFTLETEGIFRISGHASTLQQVKQDFIKGKYDNHLERNVPEEFEEDSDEEDNDKDNVTDIFHQIILNYFNYSNQINVTPINFDELFPQNRIHNVASLLKMYFRELVEPIMTFDHYDMFIASDGIPDEEVRLQVIKNVLRFLPRCNYFILRRICKFLYAIHEKKQLNKMDANNLAIVFAPNILRPPPMYNVIQTQLAEAGFANGLTQSLIRHFHFFFDQEDILQQTKVVQEELFSHYASNSNGNNNNRKGSVESKEEKKKKEEKKSEPLIVVSSSPVTTSTTTNNATNNNATTSINATNNNHITKGSVNNNSIGEDDLVPSTSSLLYNQHSKQLVEEKKRTFSKITNKPLPPPQKQNLSAFIPPIPPRKTTGNVSNNNSNNTNNNAIENTLNNAGDAKEATTLIRRLSNRIKAGDVSDLDKLNGCDDIGSASGMVMQFKTKQRPPLPVPNNNATNNNGVIKRTDSNLTEHPQEKQQMISVTNQIEESITVNVNNRNTNNLPSIPPRFQKKDNIKSAPTPTCENELPSQLVTSSKNSPPPIKPRMTVFVGGTTTTTGTNGGSNNSNNHSQSTPTPPPRSGTVFVGGNNNKASSVTTNTTTSSSNSSNPTPPPKTSSNNAGNSVLKNNPFIVNDHTTKKASPPPYPPPKRQ